jgi:hypothetical protein
MENQLTTGGLTASDFKTDGTPETVNGDVAQVVYFVREADSEVNKNLWKSGWKESDLLYQSPQPFSTYNNAYVLEPNVRRFTIAKDVNSIVPQFYKGLFYENPPFMFRPGAGGTQEIASYKKDVMGSFLQHMNFEREVKLGLEQQVLMGTGIWQWGIQYEEETIERRVSEPIKVEGNVDPVYSDKEPKIERVKIKRCYPTFEFIDLENIFVDPKLGIPDIREASEVAKQKFVTYYDLVELKKDPTYDLPDEATIKSWFMPGGEAGKAQLSQAGQAMTSAGVVMHAQNPAQSASNPLMNKLELLEYWNRVETKTVIDRKHLIRKTENVYSCIPFLSANYWNVRKNFWGIGVGIIAGGDQRVQAGTIGAALKMLTFKVNAPYMRNSDANPPTQMIQTGLGRVLSVADVTKAYKLMETPDVPSSLWETLAESKQSTESSTGADQMLVGGSSAGPRTSMGRTAGGASILAGASATRLDGPLDNFINQVFIPFLYILDKLIFRYVSDRQLSDILGKKRDKTFVVDMQQFHEYNAEYDVLAGAKLAARAAMAQSLTLIFQLLENPQIQSNLADINGEFIDFKPLVKMLFEVSQWGPGIENDIFKPLTAEMKQSQASKSGTAQKLQQQLALNQQRFEQKSQLLDQETDNRIKQDITRDAFKAAGLNEALNGEPNPGGFGGSDYSIQ